MEGAVFSASQVALEIMKLSEHPKQQCSGSQQPGAVGVLALVLAGLAAVLAGTDAAAPSISQYLSS